VASLSGRQERWRTHFLALHRLLLAALKDFGLAPLRTLHGPSNGHLTSKLLVRDVNLQEGLSAIERRKQLDILTFR
jgi:hypothetical protein